VSISKYIPLSTALRVLCLRM